MIEIRFKDIDPDSGEISQDMKIAQTESALHANWIKQALEHYGADEPNREFYSVNLIDPKRKLTYEERIAWFVANYYETGMEYSALLDGMRDSDLDNFKWYDETIKFPKTVEDLKLSQED